MGYVAYAAGTLIAAGIIHSLWSKKSAGSIAAQAHCYVTNPPVPAFAISEPSDAAHERRQRVPSVGVAAGRDDEEPDESSTRSDSPPHVRGIREQNEPPMRVQTPDTDAAAELLTRQASIVRVQSQEMRPPRVSSAPNLQSVASQARQRAAMPPPASLPPSRSRSPPRLKPATASSLAPPPRPGGFPGTLAPPTSSSATLRVPQQKVLVNTHMQPATSLSTSTQPPASRPSRKVILSPGHSPLDWAALTRSTSPSAPTRLRGADATSHLGPYRLGRITPSQLRHQNGRKGKDAWTSYQGRVYNISAYLDFHPGGRNELMKGAGRSSDKHFAEVHPWVNWEGMLGGCCIGLLVSEDDPAAVGKGGQEQENELDEMD